MFDKISLIKKLLDVDDNYLATRGINTQDDDDVYNDYEEDIDVDKLDKLFFEKNREKKPRTPKDFTIKPSIAEEDDYLFISENLPKIPFSMMISGARGAGKSVVCLTLLELMKDYFDEVIIFSPTIELDIKYRNCFEKLDMDFEFGRNIFTTYSESILTRILLKIKNANKNKPFKDKARILMIFEDIITSLPKNKRKTIFNKLMLNNRHYNVSIIINSQSFKLFDSNMRKNCSQIILFRTDNVYELENYWRELSALLGDSTRECRENFLKIYNYATLDKHSFLYLNYHNKPKCFFKNLNECINIKELLTKKSMTFLERIE